MHNHQFHSDSQKRHMTAGKLSVIFTGAFLLIHTKFYKWSSIIF